MARNLLKTAATRVNSSAYVELYNQDGLTVHATKAGKFEISCGSTHTIANNLSDVMEKINSLDLHVFPGSGDAVIAAIKSKASKQYRLEVKSSKDGKDTLVHTVKGSMETLADSVMGMTEVDVKSMTAGKRYSLGANAFGGDYMILVPMSAGMDMGFDFENVVEPQMYEKQPYTKGMVLHGIDPKCDDVLTICIDQIYPNGSFKDTDGKVWGADEAERMQFAVGSLPVSNDISEENFHELDESLYDSEDIPSYNPVGVVKEQAPMISNLKNYDVMLNASADVISDFMKTCKKAAMLDRSSLNKITVTAMNEDGQATDGEISWNVRVVSPSARRSSLISIPLVMKNGSIDLKGTFVTSNNTEISLTPNSLAAHLGGLAADDMYRRGSKEMSHKYSSMIRADKDIDDLLDGIGSKDTLYMNPMTGSIDTYDGWAYTNEAGEAVNAVDLGEVVEVNADGEEIFASKKTAAYEPGKKVFYTMDNLGSSKYSINYHDGVSTHKDGSPFFGIKLFKNKKDYNEAIQKFISEGYTEVAQGYAMSPNTASKKTAAYDAQNKMLANSFISNMDMYKEEIDNGSLSIKDRAAELVTSDSFEGYPKFTELNQKQVSTLVEKGLLEKGFTAEQVKEALAVLEPAIAAWTGKVTASKKTAAEDATQTYYFNITTHFSTENADEDGFEYDSEDAINNIITAAQKIDSNVIAWLNENVGSAVDTGHVGDEELGGNITVEKDSKGLEFVLDHLEDDDKEAASTTKGDLTFDPFIGVEDKLAPLFDVSLSFNKRNNLPDGTDSYASKKKKGSDQSPPKSKETPIGADADRQNNVSASVDKSFFDSYIEAAIWTSTDDDGESLTINSSDINAKSLEQEKVVCADFITKALKIYPELPMDQAGHDFWLTRNGHGAGFWDRDVDVYGTEENAEALTKLSEQYGENDLYQGDDGEYYFNSQELPAVEASVKKTAAVAIIYDIDKTTQKDSFEEGVTGKETYYGSIDNGVVWSVEALAQKVLEATGIPFSDFVVFEDGRLSGNISEDGDGMPVDNEHAKALSEADKLYLSDYNVSIKLGDGSEPTEDKLTEMFGLAKYGSKKTAAELSTPDKHQLRILTDTVKNPSKGLLGGPSATEAEQTLRSKFKYTDDQINKLKASKAVQAVRTVSKEVYQFDELSDESKKNALDSFRTTAVEYEDWSESTIDQFKTNLLDKGITVDRAYFSGFWSQGDGASFTGTIESVAKFMELNGLVETLPSFYNFVKEEETYATITTSGRYSHSGTMQLDVNISNWNDVPQEEFNQFEELAINLLRGFADQLYRDLEQDYDALTSDEFVTETIISNEYEFNVDGSQA